MNRPPYEAHTRHMLQIWDRAGLSAPLTAEMIVERREPIETTRAVLLRSTGLTHRDVVVPGPAGDIPLAILRKPGDVDRPGPVFLWLHGGGLVMGNRFSSVEGIAGFLDQFGGVIVSPEYRLAPEHPSPAAFEDCLAVLRWLPQHIAELGGIPEKIIVVGFSGGGNLALALALAVRDLEVPAPLGFMAAYPMIDDRNDTVSAQQFHDVGLWNGISNGVAWDALLGARRGTDQVTQFCAPARATWLGGLKPIFIDVASTEVFRDETVSFASRVWRDGGELELHVYPGGTHVHELFSAGTRIGRGVRLARREWIRSLLETEPVEDTQRFIASLGKYPIEGHQ